MENDLISRTAAIYAAIRLTTFKSEDELDKFVKDKACNDYYLGGICDVIDKIKKLTAVDAVPVVHGRWIDENPDEFLDPRMRCSICTGIESPLIKWRYCPNCGAKMDSERRDNE